MMPANNYAPDPKWRSLNASELPKVSHRLNPGVCGVLITTIPETFNVYNMNMDSFRGDQMDPHRVLPQDNFFSSATQA